MAEGDTILRTARRLEAALGGQEVKVTAMGRGRESGAELLDGRRLEHVESKGKHLLLHFGGVVLHSHLGMSGSWHIYLHGDRWRKSTAAAWLVLKGDESEAVQFGGPTLKALPASRLRSAPALVRLGPDLLAPDLDLAAAIGSLRSASHQELGEALLDQRLLAGIGNIFKSEACFAAEASPWRPVSRCSDEELSEVVASARRLMLESAERGRPDPSVYRRAGYPCHRCGTPIAARGQGEANRRTYWCPRCQPGGEVEARAK